ncbi:EAL domain-containing protein [Roseomonas sp. M0104]|uniref:EAL domain-containing protein n=1 Tax=Teichococcus coralli TaxID=2545983 RepID=A0A845B7I0_9PROT|nr:EAL domain-containing protein [Pseudoroseomonas coralli]MXP63593.1 EAL domain-containing protein [Pseudoroseomonas coralli]
MPTSIPAGEQARLAALEATGLMEGLPDPRIEDAAGRAAQLLERPLSAVTLLEAGRQIIRFGSPELRGFIPREASFCDTALRRPDEVLVVTDAQKDPRFAALPLAGGELGLRFYAGKPIRSPGGFPLGALCVLDHRPGHLSPGQESVLRELAREVEGLVAEHQSRWQERQALMRDLRLAVANDALFLNWQPIVEARSLRIHGYEALARWQRPRHGIVPPDRFIPLAEQDGLVGRIDKAMLRKACAEAAAWPLPARVSVNFSADWVRQAGATLPHLVEQELARSGLPADRLMIEITEGVLIDSPDCALGKIQALRSLGVRVALDDFGTGYSSLGYLERFPFDVLKIDRRFLRRLGQEPRAEVVLRATLRLGRELGMTVCVEGVEDQEQLAFLQREGCDLVQGYLLGRPGEAILDRTCLQPRESC